MIWEAHYSQAAGHFRVEKMVAVLQKYFYWLNLRQDVGVITQIVPWLLKGYGRGNHKLIFTLQVLAYLQSERALSL